MKELGINCLRDAIYASRIQCSSPDLLSKKLHAVIGGASVEEASKTIHERQSNVSLPIGQSEAEKLLVYRDFDNIHSNIVRIDSSDVQEKIRSDVRAYIAKLQGFGLNLTDVEVFFVDAYPSPYTKLGSWAMNFDEDDKKRFGLTPGIYMKKSGLSPRFSSFLGAHELVHQVFSRIETNELARGLEDGICDLVGYMLSASLLGAEVAGNILLNLRFRQPIGTRARIYVEALRQALLIYRQYGFDGIIEIMRNGNRNGRSFLKSIELQCLENHYDALGLEPGNWTEELDKLSRMVLGFPESMVASPLACIIAERIQRGDDFDDFCIKQNLVREEGEKALTELTDDLFLVLVDGRKVIFDETKAYVGTKTLRYRLLS